MTEKTYKKYLQISKTVCSDNEKASDLLHDTLIQLSTNNTFNTLPEKDKVFYITRALQNQVYSNNSKYHRTYRKHQFDEIPINYQVEDKQYDERPTLDWINETLQTELDNNPQFWYKKGLFDLWVEHKGFIHRVHKQTRIPKYSIIDTLNEVKAFIKIKWNIYKNI